MQQLYLYFNKYYLPKLSIFYFPETSASSSHWLECFMWSLLLSSCLIRKAVPLRPLKQSSVCFSCCSCWLLNTEERLCHLRSASLERRCASATHLWSGGVSKNLSPVSVVPRWLLSINGARVHLREGCASWDQESSLPPGAKKKDDESLVFRSRRLMNGCMLDLSEMEIWPVTLMFHLPQKVCYKATGLLR